MADENSTAQSEADPRLSVGRHSVSPFLRKEVKEQIANRDPKTRISWNWYNTWHEEHHRAFVVAKLCKADLLQEVHDSLQKAREEGQTFQEWRKEILPKLQGRWIGKTVGELWDELPAEEKDKRLRQKLGDSYDGLSEEEKEKQRAEFLSEKERQKVIEAKRLETIFRVNMRVANAAGHYQALMDKARLYPYWRYNTAEDNRVRESHKILHNKVFRYDDPFWDTHFPPNGWHCRCYVRAMNERDLKRRGVNPEDILDSRNLETITEDSAGGHTKLTYIIDGKKAATADGWNYNPGKINQQIDAVAEEKTAGYEPELKEQVKASLKKEEEPKPAAPQPASQPAAAPKPAQPAAAPKLKQADGAHGEPKPATAPKAVQQTVKDNNVPVKSTAAAPKPKQITAAPKSAQPKSAPTNKPAVPRIIEPVTPADPSVPRVIEPVKPEAKQSILQTIRGKVGRAVNRVLGWLGVSSKWSSLNKFADGDKQDVYYGSGQTNKAKSTIAKNAIIAQSKRQNQQTTIVKSNYVPGKSQSGKAQPSKDKPEVAVLDGNNLSGNIIINQKKDQSSVLYRYYTENDKINYTQGLSDTQKRLYIAQPGKTLNNICRYANKNISNDEIQYRIEALKQPIGEDKSSGLANYIGNPYRWIMRQWYAWKYSNVKKIPNFASSTNPDYKEKINNKARGIYIDITVRGELPPTSPESIIKPIASDDGETVTLLFTKPQYTSREQIYTTLQQYQTEHAVAINTIQGKGKVLFECCNNSRTNVNIPISKQLKRGVIIHNHPDNTVFHPDDIRIANDNDAVEIQAVCQNGSIYRYLNNGTYSSVSYHNLLNKAYSILDPQEEHLDSNEWDIEHAEEMWYYILTHCPAIQKIR